jgi:hypothetical protein
MHFIALAPSQDQWLSLEMNPNSTFATTYFAARGGDVLSGLAAGLYRVAAEVATSDLETLFEATNTISQPWMENASVTRLGTVTKSMSPGDIALDLDAGTAWLCADIGWTPIDDPDVLLVLTTKALLFDALTPVRLQKAA